MSEGKKLVAALLGAGSVETLRLAGEDLFEDAELVVFRFVKAHYRRYGQLPDIHTVEAGSRQRLPQAPETVEYYLSRLHDRKLYVSLREEFGSLRDALGSGNIEDARATVDRMKAACRIATPDNDVRDIRDASQLVLSQYAEAHLRPGMPGVPTGWPALDEMTGGYQRGDLIAWIARMKLGKTYLMLIQAIAAWMAGYNVLFVSMEMPIEQIARRWLGLETGINPDYIRRGTLGAFALRRLERYISAIMHSDRFTIYAGSFSRKVSDVDILMHQVCPDISYIDSAYRLQPDGAPKSAPRLERVSWTYDELKRLTITTDRPIVTSSQFSRGAGKRGKEGDAENVAFSDAIAMHCSLMFSVKEGAPPNEKRRRKIAAMMGREGEEGEFEINYQFDPMDFSEVRAEQRAAEAVDLNWMGGN